MAKTSKYMVPVEQSAVITAPGTFTPESTTENKSERYNSVYPVLIYTGKNYLPTAYGYKSFFGTDGVTASGMPDTEVVHDIFMYQMQDFTTYLIALTDSGIWVAIEPTSEPRTWTKLLTLDLPPVQTSQLWTYTTLAGKLFLYRQDQSTVFWIEEFIGGAGIYLDDFNGSKVTPTQRAAIPNCNIRIFEYTPTLLNMAGQIGIYRAGASLGFWDSDNSIAYSAINDPTDFEPSLTSLANLTKVNRLNGRITRILPSGRNFVIYATSSIIRMVETTSTTTRFIADTVLGNVGVSYPKEIVASNPDTVHFAWTNAGIMRISESNAEVIIPGIADYLESMAGPVYLHLINARYLMLQIQDANFLQGNAEFSTQTIDPPDYEYPGNESSGSEGEGIVLDGGQACYDGSEIGDTSSGVKPYTIVPLYRHWPYSGATMTVVTKTLSTGQQVEVLSVLEGDITDSIGEIYYDPRNEVADLGTFVDRQLERYIEEQAAVYQAKYNVGTEHVDTWPEAAQGGSNAVTTLEIDEYIPPQTVGMFATEQWANRMWGFENGSNWMNARFATYEGETYLLCQLYTSGDVGYAYLDELLTPEILQWAGYSGNNAPLCSLFKVETVPSLNLQYGAEYYEGTFTYVAPDALDGPAEGGEIVGYGATQPDYSANLGIYATVGNRNAYRLQDPTATFLRLIEGGGQVFVLREVPSYVECTRTHTGYSTIDNFPLPSHIVPYGRVNISVTDPVTEEVLSNQFIVEKSRPVGVDENFSYSCDPSLDWVDRVLVYSPSSAGTMDNFYNAIKASWNAEAEAAYAEALAAATSWAAGTGFETTNIDRYKRLINDALQPEVFRLADGSSTWVGQGEDIPIAYDYTYVESNVRMAVKRVGTAGLMMDEVDATEILYGYEPTAQYLESAPMYNTRAKELRGLMAIDEWFYTNNSSKTELDPTFLIGAAGRVDVELGMTLAEADAYGPPYDVTAQADWSNRYLSYPERAGIEASNEQVQGLVCGITTDDEAGSPEVPAIVWEPWKIETPSITYVMQNGQRAPYDPTFYGAYVFDTHLSKWGQLEHEYKVLIDYQAINNQTMGTLDFQGFQLEGGLHRVDGSSVAFDHHPADSFVRYGKFKRVSSEFTQIQYVDINFLYPATGLLGVQWSLDGRNPEYGYSDFTSFKDALRQTLHCSKIGKWGTITVSGYYDITSINIRYNSAGDR